MSDYKPAPIDTSTISLPGHMAELVEKLAENAHEVWAQKRKNEGWAHGEETDSEAKTTPWMVPYEQLPESERQTDRMMVEQVLKGVRYFDWTIAPPADCQSERIAQSKKDALRRWSEYLRSEGRTREREGNFDVDDRPELESGLLDPFPEAKSAVKHLDEKLRPLFEEADREAIRARKMHSRTAFLAIWLAAIAIVSATVQLTIRSSDAAENWLAAASWAELISLFFAVFAVILGICYGFHHSWLVSRQKAERLRSLRFLMLADSALWGDRKAWERKLEERIALIENGPGANWFKKETPEHFDLGDQSAYVSAADFRALGVYVGEKRLHFQHRHLSKKAGLVDGGSPTSSARPWFWRVVGLGLSFNLFFVSAFLVVAHWVLDCFDLIHGGLLDNGIIMVGILIPVFGFALRAWTGAFEFTRSQNLSLAKSHSVKTRIEKYDPELAAPASIRSQIASNEEFFLEEHREWCRLQAEAEWLM